jgi:hypothetical protein
MYKRLGGNHRLFRELWSREQFRLFYRTVLAHACKEDRGNLKPLPR